jgi:hypothetical protein
MWSLPKRKLSLTACARAVIKDFELKVVLEVCRGSVPSGFFREQARGAVAYSLSATEAERRQHATVG